MTIPLTCFVLQTKFHVSGKTYLITDTKFFLFDLSRKFFFFENQKFFINEMKEHTVDSADGIQVDDVVFDNKKSEKSSWKFCNSIKLPRSVLFFEQAILLFTIVITTLRKFFDQPSYVEKTV